jgi:hypothetical protein
MARAAAPVAAGWLRMDAMRHRSLLPLLPLLLLVGHACPDEPSTSPAVWRSFERTLPLAVEAANPFDPGEVAVDVELRGPGGLAVTVPAFLYQDFVRGQQPNGAETLVPDGPREWRFRFTPTRPGAWRWRWLRTTAAGVERGDWVRFVAGPNLDPDRHGFVRVAEGSRYLAFDDGTPFFPVGENLAWADHRGTFAYEDWMAKLAASGASYIRLWMPSWDMGLVYAPATLEDWSARMDRAWRLDRVIELAEQYGLQVMLSVQNHGPFELGGFFGSGWSANLYNAANGGPLAEPHEFFSDPEAREIFRRYLRYVAARWGHSPNVMCFELWNEVDLTEQPDDIQTVVDWHREMAGVLREHDPNDHLITTSTSDEVMTFVLALGNFPIEDYPLVYEPVWQMPEIDFVQLHSYQIHGWGVILPVAPALFALTDRMLQYGKPVLVAEAGVDFRGIAETLAADPEGEGFHDILWAGAFSGAFGSGMSWWWDFVVDTEDWYFHFAPLARLMDGVPFALEPPERHRDVPVEAPGRDVVAHVLASRTTTVAWIKNRDHEYYAPDRAPVAGARFVPPVAAGGVWRGEWIDPWTGATEPVEYRVGGPSGPGSLAIPTFSRDLALRLDYAPEKPAKETSP